MISAKEIIDAYKLKPLDQEGGFFSKVWRSPIRIENKVLDSDRYREEGDHPLGTIIHFLLTTESFSAMHRLPTIEHWMYHMGDAAEMLILGPNGSGQLIEIGPNLKAGQKIHLPTPSNFWQGTRVKETADGCGWFFGSAIMVPGFEWSDFELGDSKTLCANYPKFKSAILARVRPKAHEGTL